MPRVSVVVKRPPRAAGPEAPHEQVELAEPPVMGEPAQMEFSSALMMLPMGLGGGAMVLMFAVGGAGGGSPMIYVFGGVMGVSVITMGLSQIGRGGRERSRKMRAERRDYLRYLGQLRTRAREAATEQRRAVEFTHPDPARLRPLVGGERMWERRPSHDDFARVRIGRGAQRAGLEFLPPATKPVEDLEPLAAVSLRRFSRAHRLVTDVPLSASLRAVRAVELAGDPAAVGDLLRAVLGQLAVWHSPDELTIAVLTDPAALDDWQWVKWLPHTRCVAESGTPSLPLVADDAEVLMELLGPDVRDRPGHDPAEAPVPGEAFVVVVVTPGVRLPRTSRLRTGGLRGVVVLDASGELVGGPDVLRLTLAPGDREDPRARVSFAVVSDGAARDRVTGARPEPETATAVADALSPSAALELARALAPLRTGGVAEVAAESFDGDLELTTLLGIRDAHRFDVARQWSPRRVQRARLTVPIGVTEDGEVIDLDLKESAQGGMGPHGVLIGATGSGKSELLRTLVIGLAATHSSEVLNMVLVDFKGGATFLGMDRLPHTSATITNLADELPLVDRMQDSINGELLRRQELLRAHGHASLYDYEAARGAGEPLDPLPTLLVVVDEFSELLAAKPEFMDLFVQIGRVGRSLGVHLLLASQRLDEGRIHRVEGHLSYRIALRTFSAMESRSVIGVPSAYELPSAPGNGYLKVDTASLARFKAAYVSGPCPEKPLAPAGGVGAGGFVPAAPDAVGDFAVDLDAARRRADDTRDRARRETEEAEREAALAREKAAEPIRAVGQSSLLDVLIARLQGAGPEARQVWLPPLAASPGLDELLPPIVPDPERGLVALGHDGSLRVPVGVIDRPAEQVRDLLVVDLAAAGGHGAVVGGPQAGKSTLLRTLALGLALTHTPTELQIYAIDLAGGGLAPIAGLPHVGSVAPRLERDRVLRTVAELATVLELREEAFAALGVDSMAAYRRARAAGRVPVGRGGETDRHGEVVLLVDGWGTLRTEFPDLETRITELAGRASAFGVHVVVASGRWSEIRPALRNLLGTRLELRLGDAVESEIGARVAATVPSGQPGRGLTVSKEHFLAALPRLGAPVDEEDGGAPDHAAATRAAVGEVATFWVGDPAPAVRLLPASLPAASLPVAGPEHGAARVCLGLDEQRLAPVWHDFGATPHLMVLGDDETGRSNLLRLVASSIVATHTPAQARILMADPQRRLHEVVPEEYRIGYAMSTDGLTDLAANAAVSMTKRLPGEDITPEALARRDWWTGPALYLLVDDYDLFTVGGSGSPLQPLVTLLAQGAHIGLHLVITRSSSSAMRGMMDPVLRRCWELGNPGLLFSYPKEEGKFLGEAQPRTLPPGRAQLVTRRGIRLLQTGLVEPAPVPVAAAGTPGQR